MINPERIRQFNAATGYQLDPLADYDAATCHDINQIEYCRLVDDLKAMPNAERFNATRRIEELKNIYGGRNPLHCGVPNP